MKKFFLRAALILVIIFIGITVLGYFSPQIEKYLVERKEKQYQKAYEKQQKDIEEAYRNDTFGGKTPEETFDMFLAAIKKGDIELASKYYELSVRPKALASLKEELQKEGNLNQSIVYFTDVRNGEKKCADLTKEFGGCVFDYIYITKEDKTVSIQGTNDKIFVPRGSEETKFISMRQNKYTQIWKITQPY